MLAKIKYIIIGLCMLIAVNQSVHIISHIFLSHDDSQSELIHISDHKCQACHLKIQSIHPDIDFELFQWNEIFKSQELYTFFNNYTPNLFYDIKSLRAPPYVI